MTNQNQDCVNNAPESQDRRLAIKKFSAGVGVLVGCSVLPEKWTAPIVGQITLPAHAITSGPLPLETNGNGPLEADATEAAGEFNTTEEFSLNTLRGNDKRFTWLSKTGADYGGQIKFVFNGGCGELVVPDAAATHGADGHTSNHNQAFYYCGTDFAPGTKENNGNRASVFAPPNCSATSVTLHYNK